MSSKHSVVGYLLALVLTCATLISVSTSAYAQEGGIPADEQSIQKGKNLFEENCTVCHAVHSRVVGPALMDVNKRRPLPWLIDFIKNSQKVIQSGDEYAVKLYNEFNKTEMPSFDFSDEEITNILAYVKQQSEQGPVVEKPEGGTDQDGKAAQAQTGVPQQYLTYILIGLVVVLVLILVVLVLVVSVLSSYLKQKTSELDEEDREIVESKVDLKKVMTSGPFVGFVIFIFTAIIIKTVIDSLFMVGVQQAYQPTQPIAYSHALHAGELQIDCNYCHTGVRKSKNANIPSVNICMNCHHEIKTESPEIKMLYAALENNEPIEWVRIHNLPDLAYFNHAQHVEVGGIECQTCHGPIQEMEVVYQYSNLTMGWCINCHRETEVNAKGNAYYDKLVELHAEHNKEPMKVVDIGGLECSKCHY
jgi:mono/diheme cytochrome c family protein